MQTNTNLKRLIAYLIQNPSKSLRVNGDIFTEYRNIFDSIKTRFSSGQECKPDLIAKDAGVTTEHITNLALFSYINEATFQELLSEQNELLAVKVTEELLEQFFIQASHETEPKEKLALFQTLKEKLNGVSVSNNRYPIYENPSLVEEWYENYDKVKPAKIRTGLSELDDEIGGIGQTDLAILIGDTNIGKTNLLLNIVLNSLLEEKNVLYYSLEMGREQIIDRLVAMHSNLSAFEIRERKIVKDKISQFIPKLKTLDIKMADSGSITSNDIVNDIINLKARKKIDLVVIDYLQRLNDRKDRNDNETIRIATIARRLKNAALNFQTPIITPVQVDKASHKSGKIEVENVADSKVVANEADLGLYIYQDVQKVNGLTGQNIVKIKLKVVKSRHSRKNQVYELDINPHSLRINNKHIEVLDIEDIPL